MFSLVISLIGDHRGDVYSRFREGVVEVSSSYNSFRFRNLT